LLQYQSAKKTSRNHSSFLSVRRTKIIKLLEDCVGYLWRICGPLARSVSFISADAGWQLIWPRVWSRPRRHIHYSADSAGKARSAEAVCQPDRRRL